LGDVQQERIGPVALDEVDGMLVYQVVSMGWCSLVTRSIFTVPFSQKWSGNLL